MTMKEKRKAVLDVLNFYAQSGDRNETKIYNDAIIGGRSIKLKTIYFTAATLEKIRKEVEDICQKYDIKYKNLHCKDNEYGYGGFGWGGYNYRSLRIMILDD